LFETSNGKLGLLLLLLLCFRISLILSDFLTEEG